MLFSHGPERWARLRQQKSRGASGAPLPQPVRLDQDELPADVLGKLAGKVPPGSAERSLSIA